VDIEENNQEVRVLAPALAPCHVLSPLLPSFPPSLGLSCLVLSRLVSPQSSPNAYRGFNAGPSKGSRPPPSDNPPRNLSEAATAATAGSSGLSVGTSGGGRALTRRGISNAETLDEIERKNRFVGP